MEERKYYDKTFYNLLQSGSYVSAKKVLPIVQELFHPTSVLDLGCGVGYWIKVWKDELKVEDVLGIEGSYVTEDMFYLDKKFLQNEDLKMPLHLTRKYDLVMSLEVAEHIEEKYSDTFIQNLVNAGDIILFSAAIKGQIGTYHVNEQMPEYWAEKFAQHDYIPVDFIRPLIWNDTDIDYWYRQNILLFVNKEKLREYPQLQFATQATKPDFLTRIHPEKYFAYVEEANRLQSLPGFIRYHLYKIKKRIKKN
jgi:SAM-dependent methyltransferase